MLRPKGKGGRRKGQAGQRGCPMERLGQQTTEILRTQGRSGWKTQQAVPWHCGTDLTLLTAAGGSGRKAKSRPLDSWEEGGHVGNVKGVLTNACLELGLVVQACDPSYSRS